MAGSLSIVDPNDDSMEGKVINDGPSAVSLQVRDSQGHLTRGPRLEPHESADVGLGAGDALVGSDATSNDGAGASGKLIKQ